MKDIKSKFSDAYKKNAEKMEIARIAAEQARKHGDKALSDKYRKEYLSLKAEIDIYCIQLLINQ